jgi:hypothetical protein
MRVCVCTCLFVCEHDFSWMIVQTQSNLYSTCALHAHLNTVTYDQTCHAWKGMHATAIQDESSCVIGVYGHLRQDGRVYAKCLQ